ncbi:GerAB/ArcD/ProY family transporter [Paenibacillus roseipurpureus]|uniref:Endospore germination permease n=1 Tax=Paenibacillus roseopurpureus TaxID=2918901 RepID=A0AA96LLF0_9BACL|nr:endospore germination permease [Paenibacillus sp. MBLB1832]WNR43920.1 endospore germination permease [Paenibacillus sp. MBLB1832]
MRQLSWLTSSVVTSGGILTLQNVLVRINQMDAWFSYLLSIFYVFLIAAFFGYLVKLFPGHHIFEITKLLLGKWAGTAVNLLILFHFWQIKIRDISSISRFNTTLLLRVTPLEILILLTCVLLMYFGKSSVEVIARVNDLFYPLFVCTVMIMPLLLSNEIQLRLLTPAMTMPIQHWFASSILTIGSAGDIFILGAFLHLLSNAKHVRSAIRHGSLLGFFLLTLILFLIIAVLGPMMPANFSYPTYNLVQMIHVTDFLDRVDLIMLMIWFPTITCKHIAIYLAFLIGISSLVNDRNYPVINKPIALLITLSAILSFKSTTELLAFSNFASPVIVLAYQPLLMLVLVIAGLLKQRKAAANNASDATSAPTDNGGLGITGSQGTSGTANNQHKTGQLSSRLSFTQWLWSGNVLLILCVVCVLTGLMFGMSLPWMGKLCAMCFCVCLLLSTATTYMELTKLKQVKSGNE